MGEKHTVRLEPVGIEFEVDEDETVLAGAFRQGLMLMHGCKEGQCSACKSFLLDGEVTTCGPGSCVLVPRGVAHGFGNPSAEPARVLVVTTPQAAAAEVAERAGTMASMMNQRVIGVVENMSYLVTTCPHCGEIHTHHVFGKGGGADVARVLSTSLGYPV